MNFTQAQSFIKNAILLVMLSIALIQCAPAKKTVDIKTNDVKNMVDSQQFNFVAQTVTPMRGRMRNLTSSYDVNVRKDSLTSYLPYFGRAYQAPVNPSEGGIQFTSTNFSYDATNNNKGRWDVVIKFKDQREVQQFSFSIFDNGTAQLSVTSTYKDPISFYGYIKKLK